MGMTLYRSSTQVEAIVPCTCMSPVPRPHTGSA